MCAELEATDPSGDRHAWFSILNGMGLPVLPLYIRTLKHPAMDVSSAALSGITQLKEQALPAAQHLVAMLDESDPQKRSRLIYALSQIGEGAIPLLQDVRRDGPGRARAAALECLANIGGEAALSSEDLASLDRLIRIKLIDDRPEPISCCFLSWIAVSTGEQSRLMDLLDLSMPRPVTFALGTAAADSDSHGSGTGSHGSGSGSEVFEHLARVFVTPELAAGWTLVVGAWSSPADPDRTEAVLELCKRASAEFGKAQAYWFGAQNDGSAWLVAEDGVVLRRASAIDEATDELLEMGSPLPEEESLLDGVDDEFDRDFLLMEFALKLSARLSIDPLSLHAGTECSGIGQLALTSIGAEHGSPPAALRF